MRSITLPLLIGALSLSAPLAYGQAGAHGGGEITKRGTQLRDLVDRDTCTWYTGYDILARYPKINDALNELKTVHWYFGFALAREIGAIDFCYTRARLKRPANLQDDPEVLPYYRGSEEPTDIVGLRFFESKAVYVQQDLVDSFVDDRHQALFFVHEAMHSFLDPELKGRNDKIHTVIQSIRNIWDRVPTTPGSFAVMMKRNKVSFVPESSRLLEPAFLQYALSSDEIRRQMILTDRVNVSYLLKTRSYAFTRDLIDSDADYLGSIQNNLQEHFFGKYCRTRDTEVLKKLEAQANDEFDIDVLCMRYPEYADDAALQANVLTRALGRTVSRTVEKLQSVRVSLVSRRVTVSKDIELIVGNPDITTRSRIVLELTPLTSPAASAGTQTQTLIDLVVRSAKLLPQSEWLRIVGAGGALRVALDPARIVAEIDQLGGTVANEKEYAREYLPGLYTAFKIALVQAVRDQVSDDAANALEQTLNPSVKK